MANSPSETPISSSTMLTFIVQTEINNVLTSLRQSLRGSSPGLSTHDVSTMSAHGEGSTDSPTPLVASFERLRQRLFEDDGQQLDIVNVLSPFLDSIKSGDTTAKVTAATLQAVQKLVRHGFVQGRQSRDAVEGIAQSANRAQFVSTGDTDQDDAVLLGIIEVLRGLVLAPCGAHLSDETMIDIMTTLFRVCFSTLADLLKRNAELAIVDILYLLFDRLRVFKTDNVRKVRHIALRSDALGTSAAGKRKKMKNKHKPTSLYVEENAVATSKDSDEKKSDGRLPTSQTSPNISSDQHDQSIDSKTGVESADNVEDKAKADSPESSGTSHVALSLARSEQDIYPSRSPSTMTTGSVGEPPGQPYGLTTVLELYQFLADLVIPPSTPVQDDAKNPSSDPEIVLTALRLLTTAFEVAGDDIIRTPSLRRVTKDRLLLGLLLRLDSTRLPVFVAATRLAFYVYEAGRAHFKFQLEVYLVKLRGVISISEQLQSANRRLADGSTPFELKESALNAILDLWRLPGFAAELYVNYDCSPGSAFVFKDTTELLSRDAFPVHGLFPTNLLCLEALMAIVDDVERHCVSRMFTSDGSAPATSTSNSNTPSDDCSSTSQASNRRLSRLSRHPPSPNVPSLDDLHRASRRKKLLALCRDEFNRDPKAGVRLLVTHKLCDGWAENDNDSKANPCPEDIVDFFRNTPGLDKKLVGEYLGNRKNTAVLVAYFNSFQFANTRVDEALRILLETFRLPGEAPVISHMMELFASIWHAANEENGGVANPDAAYLLIYAVIMLNVDQHNTNVRKQGKPMELEEFIKNVKDGNGGGNFSPHMLTEIYQTVKREEIVLPEEHPGPIRDRWQWQHANEKTLNVVTRPSRVLGPTNASLLHVEPGVLDKELFLLTWGPAVAALSCVFERATATPVVQRSILGFRQCALIAAHYRMHDVFDNLVIALCRFTHLQNLGADATCEHISSQLGFSPKAQLAMRTVFDLAKRHGDALRHGWRNLFDIMLRLHMAHILPKELEEVEDFLQPNRLICITRPCRLLEQSQSNQGGVFSNFFGYFGGGAGGGHANSVDADDREAVLAAQTCVKECHLELLLQDTKFIWLPSLQELLRALFAGLQANLTALETAVPDRRAASVVSQDSGLCASSDAEAEAVFLLEMMLRVVLQNRDRAIDVFASVRSSLTHVLTTATTRFHSKEVFLIERCIVGIMRLAVRLLRREEVANEVADTLHGLLSLSPLTRPIAAPHICFALSNLIDTNAAVASGYSPSAWNAVIHLLRVYGCGLAPEMVDRQSAAASGISLTENFIVSPTPGEEGQPPDCVFRLHRPLNYFKACDVLTMIVDDAVLLRASWLPELVRALRTSVDAGMYGWLLGLARQQATIIARGAPRRRQMARDDASDDEDTALLKQYASYAVALIDRLLVPLLSRSLKLYKADDADRTTADDRPAAEGQSLALHVRVWQEAWCPLLQTIARCCWDPRKSVRSAALEALQRSLLHSDLGAMPAALWQHCFASVLFPLLGALLTPPVPTGVPTLDATVWHEFSGDKLAATLEESRVRVATQVVVKVFLQHLVALSEEPGFTNLWLALLDHLQAFLTVRSDALTEAVGESLLNCLLVMQTSGLLAVQDDSSTLYQVTWSRINAFLPGLQAELNARVTLPPPAPVVRPKEAEATSNSGGQDNSSGDNGLDHDYVKLSVEGKELGGNVTALGDDK